MIGSCDGRVEELFVLPLGLCVPSGLLEKTFGCSVYGIVVRSFKPYKSKIKPCHKKMSFEL